MSTDWMWVSSEMQRLLRLGTQPVGVRFCRSADELRAGTVPSAKVSVCQMIKGAAHAGWQLVSSPEQMGCFTAQMVLGFRAPSEKDTAHHIKQFVEEEWVAEQMVANKPKMAVGELAGLLTGPLGAFEPDVVVFVLDSLQAMALIEARAHVRGENVAFSNGISSAVCSYSIVAPYHTGQVNLAVPCVGARRYGAFQDHELIFSVPQPLVQETLEQALTMERNKKWPIPLVNGFLSPSVPVNYIVKPVVP